MATKDSNKNLAERSGKYYNSNISFDILSFFSQDDNISNKRMKIDSTDNQLLEFSTTNNHYSIVQQVLTDIIDKVDHASTLQTAVLQEHASIVKSHIR